MSMSASGRGRGAPSAARAVVDNKQEVLLPLDFSFKAVHEFRDLLKEHPRERGHQAVVRACERACCAGGSLVNHAVLIRAASVLGGAWLAHGWCIEIPYISCTDSTASL